MNNPITRRKYLESIKNIRRKHKSVKGINCKKIKGVSLTDNSVVYFNSIVEAGCVISSVSNNLHGRSTQAGGYVW